MMPDILVRLKGGIMSHLDGMDVPEGGIVAGHVAGHLDVDEADEELLYFSMGDVGTGDATTKGVNLAKDDMVLLGLGLGLTMDFTRSRNSLDWFQPPWDPMA